MTEESKAWRRRDAKNKRKPPAKPSGRSTAGKKAKGRVTRLSGKRNNGEGPSASVTRSKARVQSSIASGSSRSQDDTEIVGTIGKVRGLSPSRFLVEFPDLLVFEERVASESRTPVGLGLDMAQLREYRKRDQDSLASLTSLVASRRELIDYLLSETNRQMNGTILHDDSGDASSEDDAEIVEDGETDEDEEEVSSSEYVED
jgi:hypothetical protein